MNRREFIRGAAIAAAGAGLPAGTRAAGAVCMCLVEELEVDGGGDSLGS